MYNNAKPKKFKKLARQGDVLLRRVSTVNPAKLTPVPEERPGKTILAHGEVTGHHHRFEGPGVELFTRDDGIPVVKVDGLNFLRHEEHEPILPAKGTYEVVIQEEYVYGTSRKVAD